MAPSHSRQLLVWTLPTIAVLLSYLWYKKKRIGVRSDTGDTRTRQEIERLQLDKTPEPEIKEADKPAAVSSTPARNFSRSLSGVETAPIDIIIPPELRSTKSQPVDISEEELDLQIEKIKSMKNGTLSRSRSDYSPPQAQIPKTPSPIKANSQENKNIPKETTEMAQKDIAVVEEKLTTLKINNNNNNNNNKETPRKREHKNSSSDKKEQDELQRQSSERDSANHSPLDVMLASPSLSSISDNHSEGSSDSGKGGSDVATPPPSGIPESNSSPPSDETLPIIYDFFIPQTLVGKLIGRHGTSINQIKEKTNTSILVKKYPTNNEVKVCTIEGTPSDVEKALKLIKYKFPTKRYPDLTFERIYFTTLITTLPLIPEYLYLKLVEGINNDTILSCIVAPNHLFLQQPTHPTFPNLHILDGYMNSCYTATNSPLLPNPIPENTMCAAHSVDRWFRAIVLSSDAEESHIKLLDYGGYSIVKNNELRQIRGDFMLLPFQAAECYLANIKSVNEDGSWPRAAYNLVSDLTNGAIIYTQVADYAEDNIPLVLCYVAVEPRSVVFLNQHLVDNGFAEWISTDDAPAPQQENAEGAVGGINA